jgi:hypothetical protein
MAGRPNHTESGIKGEIMAIHEACQVWIEQRITEELEEKGTTGKSLRQIGREISEEIERVFEAKVKPGTIFQAARRQADTNVSPKKLENPAKHSEATPGNEAEWDREQLAIWRKAAKTLKKMAHDLNGKVDAKPRIPKEEIDAVKTGLLYLSLLFESEGE